MQTANETWSWKGKTFSVSPTGAAPRTVNGTTFQCWHVGICSYEWRDETKRLAVRSNFNKSGYLAWVDGEKIPGSNPAKAKRFSTMERAMQAAVAARKE